jgi:hypothetical protein
MSEALTRRFRCAVYTRKSTDEGLDQAYNSIDAQRDAGQAYIASQRAEGWTPVADDYDDPAFSGGTIERPALKRLLTDIERGRVDIVVVHKIDRLTRSLADFSKMVEVFERYGVSFVSVIDQALWDAVHAILGTNARARGNATRAKVPYLLKGLVFGHDGRALSPFHTTKKNGKRYRYYVPQRETKEHAGASGLPRLPAAELESAVLEQLRGILRSPALVSEVLPRALDLDPGLDEAKVTVAMAQLDAVWEQLFPAEQSRIVRLLVEKVIVSPTDLEVRLRANGIERLAWEMGQTAGEAQAA